MGDKWEKNEIRLKKVGFYNGVQKNIWGLAHLTKFLHVILSRKKEKDKIKNIGGASSLKSSFFIRCCLKNSNKRIENNILKNISHWEVLYNPIWG